MSERVKAYRERQKAAGLSQVSLWLDGPTIQLLKQAVDTQQKLPGEIVATALRTWWASIDPTTPPPHASPKEATPKQADRVTITPDITLLRALVHHMVQEELTATGLKKITAPSLPKPTPSRSAPAG